MSNVCVDQESWWSVFAEETQKPSFRSILVFLEAAEGTAEEGTIAL